MQNIAKDEGNFLALFSCALQYPYIFHPVKSTNFFLARQLVKGGGQDGTGGVGDGVGPDGPLGQLRVVLDNVLVAPSHGGEPGVDQHGVGVIDHGRLEMRELRNVGTKELVS